MDNLEMKLRKTPLYEWHVAHGADLFIDDDYPWAWHEGTDPIVEYEAIRTGAAMMDLFSIFAFSVKGPDAAEFIQRTFTNTVSTIKNGQIRYGAFVDENGILMDEGNVFRFADDKFMIMVNTPRVAKDFLKYGEGLDVEFKEITDDFSKISIQIRTSQEKRLIWS